MPDLGPHAAFIWAAYGVTALAMAALVLLIVQDDRRQRWLLAELERQGITRRSAKPRVAKPPAAKPAVTATPQPANSRVEKPQMAEPAAKPKPKASPSKAGARKPKA
jgi:heme exporter protein D